MCEVSLLIVDGGVRVREVLLLIFIRRWKCHTLISSGDNCLSTCGFSPIRLSCLTLIVVQSVRFRDVTKINEQDTHNGGNFCQHGDFSQPS